MPHVGTGVGVGYGSKLMPGGGESFRDWLPSDLPETVQEGWYKKDAIALTGQNVSLWADSGSANVIDVSNTDTATQPIFLNGKVNFETNKRLSKRTRGSGDKTLIVNPYLCVVFGAGWENYTGVAGLGYYQTVSHSPCAIGFSHEKRVFCYGADDYGTSYRDYVQIADEDLNNLILASTLNSPALQRFRVNDTVKDDLDYPYNTQFNPPYFRWLGMGGNGSHYIEEAVFCLNPSLADIQKIEGYLAHKHGLTNYLAVDDPYKLEPPKIQL